MDKQLLFKEECYAIQGAVFKVYRELGSGFLESVYQECFEKELSSQEIPFESQKCLRIVYRGEPLSQTYKADFVCFGKIIVEIKAMKETTKEHRAQVFNYLKASSLRLGLLVNFGHYPKATAERIII